MKHTSLDEFLAAIPPKRRFLSLTEHSIFDAIQEREIVKSSQKEEEAEHHKKISHQKKKSRSVSSQSKSGLNNGFNFDVLDRVIREESPTLRLVILLYRKKSELKSDTFTLTKKDREFYDLSDSYVCRSLTRLEEMGLVQISRSAGSSNVITLIGF